MPYVGAGSQAVNQLTEWHNDSMADRHSDSPFHFMQIATAAAVALFAANMCAKNICKMGYALKKTFTSIFCMLLYYSLMIEFENQWPN